MKKSGLVLFFLSFFISGLSQHWIPKEQDTIVISKNQFSMEGIGQFNGNALTSEFVNPFFYGGHITEDIKNNTLERHRSFSNLFAMDLGLQFQLDLNKSKVFNNSNLGWSFKLSQRNYMAIQYPKSLFELAFYGNANLTDSLALFPGTRLAYYDYQKLGIGIIHKKNDALIHLNLVNVRNIQNFSIYQGFIEQNANDSILILLNAKQTRSKTNGSSLAMNGFGLSIDFDKKFFILKENKKPLYFRMQLSDFGMVFLPNSDVKRVDSLGVIDGQSYDELSSSASVLNTDGSIFEIFGFQNEKRNSWLFLPFTFQMSKSVDLNSTNKLQEFYGVRYQYLIDMQVFLGLDYKWTIKNKLDYHLGVNISYGGASKFMYGSYSYLRMKNISFGLVSENLWMKSGESLKMSLTCDL